jgi:hypothetical protein
VVTGYVPAWAAFLTGFLVLLFGGSFGVWLGFGLGLEHAERAGPEWTAAELEGLASDFGHTFEISDEEFRAARADALARWGAIPPSLQRVVDRGGRFARVRRPPVEVAHGEAGRIAWEDQALAVANDLHWCASCGHRHYGRGPLGCKQGGSDEERVAAAMADLDVFMTRLLADHPEEGP